MKTEKYSRQEIIKGWNQKKITNAGICLVGDGVLSDFILADLLAIGVKRITRIGETDFFEFQKMCANNDELEQINTTMLNSEIARTYVPEVDFLIDATNDARQKEVSIQHAERNKIPFISACSTDEAFFFFMTKESLGIPLEIYHGREQGRLNSIVCSAMVTDELRKRLFSLEYDIEAGSFIYQRIKEREKVLDGRKIALVGAGAAGTFAGLGLAFENAVVSIFDFDVAEESNLSRQIFYYDAVGKHKSPALAEKLQKYGGKFKGIIGKVDEKFDASGYDALVSCVDTFSTRMVLNRLAKKYGVPLVNCGVSLYEGEVNGYVPGKTACIDCQMLGALSAKGEEKKREGGSCIVQPSLIIPNQIVGGLVVEELRKIFRGEMPEIMRYSSGDGIFPEAPKTKCLETCVL